MGGHDSPQGPTHRHPTLPRRPWGRGPLGMGRLWVLGQTTPQWGYATGCRRPNLHSRPRCSLHASAVRIRAAERHGREDISIAIIVVVVVVVADAAAIVVVVIVVAVVDVAVVVVVVV